VARVLRRDALAQALPRLTGLTTAQRAALPGVSPQRASQLVAGALVADAALDLLGVDELLLSPWALREGVLLRRIDAISADELPV
jgi:exopolyphosphatase/guanosine-5'-triphosphate,3'-diphosphate pyrophosphatase